MNFVLNIVLIVWIATGKFHIYRYIFLHAYTIVHSYYY